jgi:hypothetical protein
VIPVDVYPVSGNVMTSLDVDGVSSWSDSPNVVTSVRAATDAEAAQLADWQARQVAMADAANAAAIAGAPLSGSGPPANSLGVDGQTYIDVDSNFAYGPKSGGVWPVGATVQLPRA